MRVESLAVLIIFFLARRVLYIQDQLYTKTFFHRSIFLSYNPSFIPRKLLQTVFPTLTPFLLFGRLILLHDFLQLP